MGYLLKQSSTVRPLLFLMIDSSDHVTGKTSLQPAVTLSKNGGAFAAPAGVVAELANGWYTVAGNATDTNTVGPLVLHAEVVGADPTDDRFEVVAFDPGSASNLGLAALPAANPGAAGGLPTTNGSKLNQTADLTAGQTVTANVTQINGALTDGTPPVASRPILSLQQLRCECALANQGAFHVTNTSPSGYAEWLAGAGGDLMMTHGTAVNGSMQSIIWNTAASLPANFAAMVSLGRRRGAGQRCQWRRAGGCQQAAGQCAGDRFLGTGRRERGPMELRHSADGGRRHGRRSDVDYRRG